MQSVKMQKSFFGRISLLLRSERAKAFRFMAVCGMAFRILFGAVMAGGGLAAPFQSAAESGGGKGVKPGQKPYNEIAERALEDALDISSYTREDLALAKAREAKNVRTPLERFLIAQYIMQGQAAAFALQWRLLGDDEKRGILSLELAAGGSLTHLLAKASYGNKKFSAITSEILLQDISSRNGLYKNEYAEGLKILQAENEEGLTLLEMLPPDLKQDFARAGKRLLKSLRGQYFEQRAKSSAAALQALLASAAIGYLSYELLVMSAHDIRDLKELGGGLSELSSSTILLPMLGLGGAFSAGICGFGAACQCRALFTSIKKRAKDPLLQAGGAPEAS